MVQGKKAPARKGGYVSSSIFKPSSSDTAGDVDPDVEAAVYTRQFPYDDALNAPQQPRPHSTQKIVKLKQLRLQGEGRPSGGKYMFQRRKQAQNLARTGPYKKAFVASASLPGIDKTDTLSNTPSNYRIRRAQGSKLSPGNLRMA